jgi:mono/diheme cytochrome c family protein
MTPAGRPVNAPDEPASPLGPAPVQPGLAAEYRALADQMVALRRIDAKPALYLEEGSLHPRLPPGRFEAVWRGLVEHDRGPITFSAFAAGELRVSVGGKTVLEGRGDRPTARLEGRPAPLGVPGPVPIEIRYRSPERGPARLQLWWEGSTFAREPVPAWRFGHTAGDASAAWEQAQQIAHGRALAGRLGCAGCHSTDLPVLAPPHEPRPGPDLGDASRRLSRDWLMRWLAEPTQVRGEARMPALFAHDRQGDVERWLIACLLSDTDGQRNNDEQRKNAGPGGDHRQGRLAFCGLGCATCHFVPDIDRNEQKGFERTMLTGLADRYRPADLAQFLRQPHRRYPDGRMPDLRPSESQANDIAAYLLLWSTSASVQPAAPPSDAEIRGVMQQLGVTDAKDAAMALMKQKRCATCHTGLDQRADSFPLKPGDTGSVRLRRTDTGCLGRGAAGVPRFTLADGERRALTAYLQIAATERHPSPSFDRQRQLERSGCVRCHQRDTDGPPVVEAVGSTLGGAFLQSVPFQRTPRLTFAHQKYTRGHLTKAVADSLPTLRSAQYTYRMPAYGDQAAALVHALAEADGEIPTADTVDAPIADPNVGAVFGPQLAGSQGYSCISCHVWNDKLLAPADPGAVGPDLTRTAGRIRREWFDRFLENPARYHPSTPMPSVFQPGQPAPLQSVLAGDAAKQKEALWSYFAFGKTAPSPQPPPPVPIAGPVPGEPAIVAQIPIYLPDSVVVESICLLSAADDLLVYDLAAFAPRSFYAGGQILRTVQGRVRQFRVGTAAGDGYGLVWNVEKPLVLATPAGEERPAEQWLLAYERLADGFRLTREARFQAGRVTIVETTRLAGADGNHRLLREIRVSPLMAGARFMVRVPKLARIVSGARFEAPAPEGADPATLQTAELVPDAAGKVAAVFSYPVPKARRAQPYRARTVVDEGPTEGSLERPGYRAVAYPRLKTASGEDRIMPGALAVHPRDGRVFVASLKTGELFALRDAASREKARFENYGRGLFQDALSMLAEDDGLLVLHRRNLSRLVDADGDGLAERVERVAALPHGVADTYDYAYGLVRDRRDGFILSYAPYADARLTGAGSAIRLRPGQPPEEIAFGMRNPLGWCTGPDGEVFFTDNQGEWVATNKLCHLVPGQYFGFPNRAQPQHIHKPKGRTTIWVPYAWARSINGVAYDHTGGKFGPFAGQLFLAELMFGGALLRANVEKVNGVYQGACFPFWGKGLLGPVCLAFDPNGPLYVGGITEPGWMSMPDRGALFRIDFTGEVPFEMQSIHVRPSGFRIVYTRPVDRKTAADPASYQLEHYRYEYTGAYGSPELDRTAVRVVRADVAPDGRSVELMTAGLVPDRVYRFTAAGVRSISGSHLVHASGAYTLNEIPRE